MPVFVKFVVFGCKFGINFKLSHSQDSPPDHSSLFVIGLSAHKYSRTCDQPNINYLWLTWSARSCITHLIVGMYITISYEVRWAENKQLEVHLCCGWKGVSYRNSEWKFPTSMFIKAQFYCNNNNNKTNKQNKKQLKKLVINCAHSWARAFGPCWRLLLTRSKVTCQSWSYDINGSVDN